MRVGIKRTKLFTIPSSEPNFPAADPQQNPVGKFVQNGKKKGGGGGAVGGRAVVGDGGGVRRGRGLVLRDRTDSCARARP